MCDVCHHVFVWVRKGVVTRPVCPLCGSDRVDAVEG